MKVKCKNCGKKEAEFMSKAEIKISSFMDITIANKVLNMIDNILSPNYIVCKACGHVEKA